VIENTGPRDKQAAYIYYTLSTLRKLSVKWLVIGSHISSTHIIHMKKGIEKREREIVNRAICRNREIIGKIFWKRARAALFIMEMSFPVITIIYIR
jgi:hypothetical protein